MRGPEELGKLERGRIGVEERLVSTPLDCMELGVVRLAVLR